jgi:plasmid maintenance system antidote protein VapI
MGESVDKVKKLVRAGSSIPGAIKESLGESIRAIALKHGRNYNNFADVVNGKRAPTDRDVAALIAELGGTEQEWKELLHEAGRPIAEVG